MPIVLICTKGVIPVIKKGLQKSGSSRIIDLASGGGGGLLSICEYLEKEVPELKITLTDLYPNVAAFEQMRRSKPCFDYVSEPVDATSVPKKLRGFRPQFLSFHHLRPLQAQQVLQNAVDTRNCIGIFEAQDRSVLSMTAMFFSPLTLWLITPLIRPFRLSRMIFTYFIPVLPLMVCWDGIVSSLRTYSLTEMQSLIQSLEQQDSFEWEMGKVRSGPGQVQYLLGYPKKS